MHFIINNGFVLFSKQDYCGNNLEKGILISIQPPFCSILGNRAPATQFNAVYTTIKSFSVQKIQNDIKKIETLGVRLANHKSQNASFPKQSIGPLTKFE